MNAFELTGGGAQQHPVDGGETDASAGSIYDRELVSEREDRPVRRHA